MQVLIRAGDALPIYRQLMRQIAEAIVTGRVRPGEKLPSHRELAEQLVVAPLTVKKAYDELEAEGLLDTQRGRGTFACLKPPRRRAADDREAVQAAARHLLSLSHLAGLELRDVITLLTRLDRDWRAEEHASAARGAKVGV